MVVQSTHIETQPFSLEERHHDHCNFRPVRYIRLRDFPSHRSRHRLLIGDMNMTTSNHEKYITGAELKALCKNTKLKDVVIRNDGHSITVEVSNDNERAIISRPAIGEIGKQYCFIDMYGNGSCDGAWRFFIENLKPSDKLFFYAIKSSTQEWENKYRQRWEILMAYVERKAGKRIKAWNVPLITEFTQL